MPSNLTSHFVILTSHFLHYVAKNLETSNHMNLILEILGSSFSIIYSLLLMKEKILGWPFGIISSILGAILFYKTKLYAQSMISVYYMAIGIYGWMFWMNAKKKHVHIRKWNLQTHIVYVSIFGFFSVAAAYYFQYYTDSASPYLDSFLTLFGFLASIKEARKILTSWIYWLVINLFSGWLYYSQGLNFYAGMMLVYTAICIPGYLSWLKIYRKYPVDGVIGDR